MHAQTCVIKEAWIIRSGLLWPSLHLSVEPSSGSLWRPAALGVMYGCEYCCNPCRVHSFPPNGHWNGSLIPFKPKAECEKSYTESPTQVLKSEFVPMPPQNHKFNKHPQRASRFCTIIFQTSDLDSPPKAMGQNITSFAFVTNSRAWCTSGVWKKQKSGKVPLERTDWTERKETGCKLEA